MTISFKPGYGSTTSGRSGSWKHDELQSPCFNLILLTVLSSPKALAQDYELVSFSTEDGGSIGHSNTILPIIHGYEIAHPTPGSGTVGFFATDQQSRSWWCRAFRQRTICSRINLAGLIPPARWSFQGGIQVPATS